LIKKNSPVLLYSLFALIGCIILNTGIFNDYAYLDAAEFIWTADNDPNFKNLFIQGGRFLYGITSEFVYGTFCNTISDLKWVRFFTLLGCVAFSTQIFAFLLSKKMKIYESALFSFLILSIPSFSIYYGWSATYEVPIVLNLSFLAGVILININKKKHKLLNYFIALFLIVLSLCLYQSAATAFLIPFVFSVVLTKKISIKSIIHLLVFLVVSFSIYFVVFKLSLVWYQLEPINRTKIDLIKLPFKSIIFYLKEMRMLLYGSGFFVWPIVFLIIGAFSFLGFFYLNYTKKSEIPQFLLLMLFLILVLPLTYLPNLLSVDNYVCSRTIAPAAILILFYQFIFFKELTKRNKGLRFLSLTLALIQVVLGSYNLNHYITRIHNKEFSALKTAFNKTPLNNTKKIIIIRPNNEFLQEFNFYKREYADEFGHISSSRIWVPEPLFKQISKERLDLLNIEKKNLLENKVEVYNITEDFNDDDAIVINLVEILKKEFSKK